MPRPDALSLSALLPATRVRVGLPGETKADVIAGVVALLDGDAAVADLDRLRADVLEREELMTTGVGKGLALPHARTRGVNTTAAAFAVTREPIVWDSDDGQPVRLVLLLVGPEDERSTHVRLLGRVSRLMSDDAVRAHLLAAESEAAVLAAFREAEERIG